jgi:hypothetical protein
MVLPMAICEICPASEGDIMISVLLNLFDTRASLMSLLKLMIDREIAHTGAPIIYMPIHNHCLAIISRKRGRAIPKQFNVHQVSVRVR